MTKTSKSYFGKYFRYKLAQNKPVIFIYALLNFLTFAMPQIMIYDFFYKYANQIGNSFTIGGASENALKIMRYSIALSVIVITITTIKSMRIYHDRAAMDTLGCLPLSYGERFWGELLSGMSASFISLIPFYVISLFFKKPAEPLLQRILNDTLSNSDYALEVCKSEMDKMHTFSMLALIVIISYIGVYAVTTFISSCCGKFGTSVVYSFVTMAVIPGVYWVYANYFYSNVVGADPFWEICSKVGMLPPLGWVLSIIMRRLDRLNPSEESERFDYLVNRPICIIVPILIIAAILLGAYLIGKKRKAEKTGEGFVFKSVFYVLVMTLLVLVVGLTTFIGFENKVLNWVIILPLAFLLYSAMEVSQNNGFKGFWKTVLRFAAVVGACAAFIGVIKVTNSFGSYKKLPTESSIKEARVAGLYFFSEYGNTTYHTYKSDESVSAILSEHEKLLDNDGLQTGHMLIIDYVTQSGKEIRRSYSANNNDPSVDRSIRGFCDAVNRLQEFDPSILGVIGGDDFDGMVIEYNRYAENGQAGREMIIRSEKAAELAEILRDDIKNYYYDDNSTGRGTVGDLRFRDENGNKLLGHYRILDVYEATRAFLDDPANSMDPIEQSSVEYFSVTYRTKEEGILSDISVIVSKNDTSEYAKELLSYIEPTHSINHTPPCFIISDNTDDEGYKISSENDQAALKAMLGLLGENKS